MQINGLKDEQKKQEDVAFAEVRNSNIELLRIIMMLALIAHHLVVNSGVDAYQVDNVSAKVVFLQIFGMWGKTAINVFTLITGYYMVKREIKIKKVVKIASEVYFYAFSYFIILSVSHYQPFSIIDLIKTILIIPFDVGRYYVGSMVMMLLFIPSINHLISSYSKKQYELLLGLLLFYFTVLSSVKFNDNFDFVIWLIVVYMIGGYFRLYPIKMDNLKSGLIGLTISIFLMISSVLCVDLWGDRIGIADPSFFFSDANKALAIVASIFIFITFKNLNIEKNRIVNRLASTTFGVLLLHSCSPYVRKLLWVDVFGIVDHVEKGSIYIYVFCVIFIVFFVASFIDMLRQRFVEKPMLFLLDKFPWWNKALWGK